MPVTYTEIDNSPKIAQDTRTGVWTAEHMLKCAWDDRVALMDQFLTPYPGVVHSLNSAARAYSASALPFGISVDSGDTEVMAWEFARVTIRFSTPSLGQPIVDSDGNILSETIEESAEFLTLDHKDFRWGSSDGPKLEPEEAPGRLSIGFDYVFTRYNVETIPHIVLELLGFCNTSVVRANYLGLLFAPESLLYVAFSLNHRSDNAGQVIDYTMRFAFRRNWNEFWRINKLGGAGYERIYNAGGGTYENYPLGDFELL